MAGVQEWELIHTFTYRCAHHSVIFLVYIQVSVEKRLFAWRLNKEEGCLSSLYLFFYCYALCFVYIKDTVQKSLLETQERRSGIIFFLLHYKLKILWYKKYRKKH